MGTIHKEEKRPRSNQREEQTKEPPPIITTTMNARAIRGARAVAGARSARVAQAARVARVSRRSLTLRAKAQDMSDALEEAINEAKETCEEDPKKADCAVAWDNVEEISAEISHKKAAKKNDPLEDFCDDNPEADECRVYED